VEPSARSTVISDLRPLTKENTMRVGTRRLSTRLLAVTAVAVVASVGAIGMIPSTASAAVVVGPPIPPPPINPICGSTSPT